jgi:hydrogenase nickel incorporation protein HypA/HybF
VLRRLLFVITGSSVHELSIAESIVSGVCERIADAHVTRVIVEIGVLSGVVADSVRFFFDACIKGTPLAGAALEIVEVKGLARCRSCGAESQANDLALHCPCGSLDVELVRGDKLLVKAVEVT